MLGVALTRSVRHICLPSLLDPLCELSYALVKDENMLQEVLNQIITTVAINFNVNDVLLMVTTDNKKSTNVNKGFSQHTAFCHIYLGRRSCHC